MYITNIKIENFKRFKGEHEFDFTSGGNVIVGPNYSGKSTLMLAILIGIVGNSVAEEDVKDLSNDGAKGFKILLTFSTGLRVYRDPRNAMLYKPGEDEASVLGHTAVNKAMAEILNMPKDVFLKVYASLQGSPQKLLEMEGAELQKFIEAILGLQKMDLVIKRLNQLYTSEKDFVERIQAGETGLLPPEEIGEKERRVADMQTEQGWLSGKLEALEAEFALRKQEELAASDAILTGSKFLADFRVYETRMREVTRRKAELPETIPELIAEEPYRAAYREARELMYNATTELDAQMELIAKWDNYHARASELKHQLSRLSTREVYNQIIEDYAQSSEAFSLREKFHEEQENLRSQYQKALSAYESAKRRFDSTEAKLKAVVAEEPLEPLDITERAMLVSDLKSKVAVAAENKAKLTQAFTNAVCPTCKRPYDAQSTDQLKSEAEAAIDLYQELLLRLDTETATLATLEVENSKRRRDREVWRDAVMTLKTVGYEVEETQKVLDNTLIYPESSIEEERRAFRAYRLEVETARANARDARNGLEYLSDTESRLALLKQPEAPQAPLESFKDAVKKAQASVELASNRLSEVCTYNMEADRCARELATIRELELGIIKPEGVQPNIPALEAAYAEAQTASFKLAEDIKSKTASLNHIAAHLPILEYAVRTHRQQVEASEKAAAKADLYRRVSTLLSNSRMQFVEEAMAVVFAVTSEFVAMATSNDISRVFLDGCIQYTENDRDRRWASASGAQRSLIGLGMKFGIAQLMLTDFSSLLLDEVGADMDDEISMKATLAMSLLSEQMISITHRKMDIAGNVIELGR